MRDEKLVRPLTSAVALLHTTSPSYLLMASLEQAGAWLANEGEMVMQRGVRRIAALEAAAASWQNLAIERDSDWRQDPFKLYLTSAHASGETIARLLDARGCIVEMSDGRGCLLMLPLDGGDPALAEILADVDQALAEVDEAIPAPCYLRETPRVDVPLAEAWLAPRRALPLEKAVGQTAAALLEAYRRGSRCCFLASASRRESSMPGQRADGTQRRALRCSTTREKAYIIGSSHSAPRAEMQGGL